MSEIYIPKTLDEYADNWKWLQSLKDRNQWSMWEESMRYLALNDLFFFVNYISSDRKKLHSATVSTDSQGRTVGQPLHFHQFYLDLCKQVTWAIDNYKSTFDGSARRGGKSTIRTKNASIQMALKWPDIAICIFSVELKLARRHLRVIKEELETNQLLKVLFSDRLFDDPITAARNGDTVWSMEDGLRLKRLASRANQTFEANTFFGGGPTGSGYDVIHFDDCENGAYTSTQDMISKLHEAFASAVMLATPNVIPVPMVFVTNTFYHPEGVAKKKYDEYKKEDPRLVRLVPGEDFREDGDCPMGGRAIYPFTPEILQMKFKEAASKDEYAIQYCCDFTAGQDRTFNRNWIHWYDEEPEKMMKGRNSYVCIDCSKGLYDPMAAWVWSCGVDKRMAWTGGFRKKLDPASPAFFDEIFNLCSKVGNLSDRLVEIRVEQMNQQVWAELIRSELQKRGMFTPVIPCKGKLARNRVRKFDTSKLEREWQRWSPALQNGEILFPRPHSLGGRDIPTADEKGNNFFLVDHFLSNEYDLFPRAPHDDLLDAGGLIWEPEMEIIWPTLIYRQAGRGRGNASWKSA